MRNMPKLMLATFAGIATGALAIQAIHAQANPPPISSPRSM